MPASAPRAGQAGVLARSAVAADVATRRAPLALAESHAVGDGSASGVLAFAGLAAGVVRVWQLDTGKTVDKLKVGKSPVVAVTSLKCDAHPACALVAAECDCPNMHVLLAATRDRLAAWSMSGDRCELIWEAKETRNSHGYCSLALSSDGDALYVGYESGDVMEYTNLANAFVPRCARARALVKGIFGSRLSHPVAGPQPEELKLRRLIFSRRRVSPALCVAVGMADGDDGPPHRLVLSGGEGMVTGWRLQDGRACRSQMCAQCNARPDEAPGAGATARVLCVCSLGGTRFASGDTDGRIVFWDASSWLLVRTHTCERAHAGGAAVNALGWSSALSVLYSGGDDNTVRAWYDYKQLEEADPGGEGEARAEVKTVECCRVEAAICALTLGAAEGTLYVGNAREKFFGFHVAMIPVLGQLVQEYHMGNPATATPPTTPTSTARASVGFGKSPTRFKDGSAPMPAPAELGGGGDTSCSTEDRHCGGDRGGRKSGATSMSAPKPATRAQEAQEAKRETVPRPATVGPPSGAGDEACYPKVSPTSTTGEHRQSDTSSASNQTLLRQPLEQERSHAEKKQEDEERVLRASALAAPPLKPATALPPLQDGSHGVGHKSKELPPLRGVGILKAGTPLALPLPTDASEGTDTDGDTGADARPTADVSVDARARAQLSPAHALTGTLSSGSNASTPAKTPSRKRTGFVPERNMTVL